MTFKRQGFTYIELLVALAIIAMLFVPTMQLFSHAMAATHTSRDLITAVALARRETERLKNLDLKKDELRKMGNGVWPPLQEAPFELNGSRWRVERRFKPSSSDTDTDPGPLEVSVMARKEGEARAVVEFVTLIEDFMWSQEKG